MALELPSVEWCVLLPHDPPIFSSLWSTQARSECSCLTLRKYPSRMDYTGVRQKVRLYSGLGMGARIHADVNIWRRRKKEQKAWPDWEAWPVLWKIVHADSEANAAAAPESGVKMAWNEACSVWPARPPPSHCGQVPGLFPDVVGTKRNKTKQNLDVFLHSLPP